MGGHLREDCSWPSSTLYKRSDGKWAWRLRADNGEIIAVDGCQGYENLSDARDMSEEIVRGEFKTPKRTTG
jgi:hypothetical protein